MGGLGGGGVLGSEIVSVCKIVLSEEEFYDGVKRFWHSLEGLR